MKPKAISYSGCLNDWPVRRNGSGVVLPSLPPEIYIHILEDLPDENSKSHLSRFALTCRFFRHLAICDQFKTIEFPYDWETDSQIDWETDWQWEETDDEGDSEPDFDDAQYQPPLNGPPKNITFATMINAGDENALALAREVKTCVLRGWSHSRALWRLEQTVPAVKQHLAYFHECVRALPFMSNIETLRFDECGIDIQCIKTISTLRSLQALDIQQGKFYKSVVPYWRDDDDGPETFKKLARCLRLRILDCGPGSANALFCRYIRTRPLRTLRSMNWQFLKHIMAIRPALQLTHLSVDCPLYNEKKLWTYLSLAPSITSLSIHSVEDPNQKISTIHPPNFLPNLISLHAPLAIAATFSQQTSLKELSVVGIWLPDPKFSKDMYQSYFGKLVSILDGIVFSSVKTLTASRDVLGMTPLNASFPNIDFDARSDDDTSSSDDDGDEDTSSVSDYRAKLRSRKATSFDSTL